MLLQRFHVPCIPHFLIGDETSFDQLAETPGGIMRPQVRGKIVGEEEKVVLNKEEIERKAKELLGKRVVTNESGPDGFPVTKLLFIPSVLFEKQLYVSVSISFQGEIIVRVREGRSVFSEVVPDRKKLFRFQLARLVSGLQVTPSVKASLANAIDGLVAAFFSYDALRIEIDPFIVTDQKSLLAYKVRMTVDENALFRQKEIGELLKERQQTARERVTTSAFSYMLGEGTIGCLANGKGSGLYMAHVLAQQGGSIAGILDIGEVCTKERIMEGLNVLIQDPVVKVVCINLLTGLMDGRLIASTMLHTLSTMPGGGPKKRFFMRLEGTNAQGGCSVTASSFILRATRSLEEAAHMAVTAAKV